MLPLVIILRARGLFYRAGILLGTENSERESISWELTILIKPQLLTERGTVSFKVVTVRVLVPDMDNGTVSKNLSG